MLAAKLLGDGIYSRCAFTCCSPLTVVWKSVIGKMRCRTLLMRLPSLIRRCW